MVVYIRAISSSDVLDNLQTITNQIPGILKNSQRYAVALLSHQGAFLYANGCLLGLLQEPWGAVQQKDFGNHLYPDDTALIAKQLAYAQARPENNYSFEIRSSGNLPQMHWEFSAMGSFGNANAQGVLVVGHPLSESEKKMQQIQEYAQKVETIIENITDAFFVIDRSWNFLKVNTAFTNLVGFTEEELYGNLIWNFFPDYSMQHFPKELEKAMFHYETICLEEYFFEQQKWFEVTAYPSAEGLTVFMRNVTEERTMRDRLKLSEHKLKAVLNSTKDSNILLSPEYQVLSFNKVAEEMALEYFGKPMQVGESFWEFVVPGTEGDFTSCFEKALQGQDCQYTRRRKINNHTEQWFRVHYIPVYDDTQQLIGVALNTTNVHQKVETEHKLRAILNSTTESNVLISPRYEVMSFNRTAANIILNTMQKTLEEGKSIYEYLPTFEHEDFTQSFAKAMQGIIVNKEKKLVIANVTEWFRIQYYPAYDTEGTLIGVSFNATNISEQKQYAQKLLWQNKKLRKIAFLQSHVMRRPVASLMGFSKIIQAEKERYREDISPLFEYLQHFDKVTEELDAIIRDIVNRTDELE